MYNEAFARAVLAERARDREAALFLERVHGRVRTRSRGVDRDATACVRAIVVSMLRVVARRPGQTMSNDDCCALADV
jgi:hypothetical protein